MDSLDINDYKEQLSSICPYCNRYSRCKDKLNHICSLKKVTFSVAKKKYLKGEK